MEESWISKLIDLLFNIEFGIRPRFFLSFFVSSLMISCIFLNVSLMFLHLFTKWYYSFPEKSCCRKIAATFFMVKSALSLSSKIGIICFCQYILSIVFHFEYTFNITYQKNKARGHLQKKVIFLPKKAYEYVRIGVSIKYKNVWLVPLGPKLPLIYETNYDYETITITFWLWN